jgi:hypothetical protein
MAASAPDAQILLGIDQGEELFTVAEPEEKQGFLAVLGAALSQPLPLQAVMTIRADAMGELQKEAALVNRFETQPLGPLPMERYREIIEGPARVAGLKVEESLVARAIRDTETEDALPLLAFALRELYDHYGGDGLLAEAEYQALGDVASGLTPLENAVRRRADRVFADHRPTEEETRAVREAFVPAMVRVNQEGSFTRRATRWEDLPPAARPLLQELVAARLLVRRQAEGEGSTLEVAHEALLRAWPLLRGWLEQSREFLLGRQQLEEDLAQWQAASPQDKPEALLSGLKLSKAKAWLAEQGEQLSGELQAFIEASLRRAQAQRRLVIGSAAAAFTLISGAAGVAYWQLQQARAAQALQFEASHRALLESDPFSSVIYGLAAADSLIDGSDPWSAAQLSQSLHGAIIKNPSISAPIPTGQYTVSSLIELKNGELISLGWGGTLRRWRDGLPVGEGKPIAMGQDGIWSRIELISGWGRALGGWRDLLSLVFGGTLQRWHGGTPVGVGESLFTGYHSVNSVIELENGELITGHDDFLRRWRDGKPVGDGKPIATGQGPVMSLIELKNGELISGGEDGTLRRWRDGKPVGDGKPIATGQGPLHSLIELKNGELISAGTDGSLKFFSPQVAKGVIQAACEELREHPALLNPQTEAETAASKTCKSEGSLK